MSRKEIIERMSYAFQPALYISVHYHNTTKTHAIFPEIFRSMNNT
ncbi:TPA: hypothetical protein ACUI23_000027 [Staphylococcus pseudintermedius]